MNGKMIVLEGIDGSGKTTQVKRLVEYLTLKGFDVLQVREPGGTEVGEKIREILLNVDMDPLTELMLFTASRIENIKLNILPALAQGKVIVCDRFVDSTFAYQGYGRMLKYEVMDIQPLIDNLVKSDHTLFLDLRLEDSIKRMNERFGQKKDRLDSLNIEIKQRICDGYAQAYENNPDRNIKIDASGTIDEVTSIILEWVDNFFIPNNQTLIMESSNV